MKKRIIDPKQLKAYKRPRQLQKAPLLDDFLNDWLDTYIVPFRKPSTILNYRSYICHINEVIGDYTVNQITPLIVTCLIEHLLREGRTDSSGGLAPKTVREIRNVLHQAMDIAVKKNYLRNNPVVVKV